jgi:hypothetical protein
LVVPTAGIQTITPIVSGAIVASEEPVMEIAGYADVFVQLTENHLADNRWSFICSKLNYQIEARSHMYAGELRSLDTLVQKRIEDIKHRISKTDRNRRGLFDFVGDIASSLFGIPSASDVRTLKEANERLADAVEGVVQHERQITAKVNILGRKQQEIAEKVNQLISHQAEQYDILASRIRESDYVIRTILQVTRINTLLDVVEANLREYEGTLAMVQAMRVSCESRIITEQLIPPIMVEHILASGQNQREIDPVNYYAYIQVRKITEIDGKVYCMLRAPLFASDKERQISIVTVPTCIAGKCLKLYQPEPFIINYATEELYYPSECSGPKPRACRPGVKYDKRELPCLHGLINGDPTQQAKCPLTVYKDMPPPQPIATVALNRYIVSTGETIYHYRCPQLSPRTGSLLEGSYVIDIEPNCVLDAMSWMLQGLPTKEIQYSNPIQPARPINLTWLEIAKLPIANHTALLPVGVSQLTLPNYTALEMPPPSSVRYDIDQIQSNLGKTHWLIWLLLGISLAIGLLVAVFYVKMKFFSKRARVTSNAVKDNKINKQTEEAIPLQVIEPTGDDRPDNSKREVSLQVSMPKIYPSLS